MKKDTHPKDYRKVIFKDLTSGEQFLFGSCVETKEKGTFNGAEYSLVEVEISSASHPFYTGKKTTIDRAGRVDKFKQRAAAAGK